MLSVPLMRVAIDAAMFYELSEDDVLDPDAAVRQLELLAATLQEMPSDDRRQLLEYVQQQAGAERSTAGDTAVFRFLSTFGENLGL